MFNKTYNSTIEFLYAQLPMFQNIGKKAYKKDLGNIKKLCELLGNPHKKFKSIHIAGTNGKGSTANIISAIFQASNYKVGLYTSPHYVDFRERIRINGALIPEKEVIEFVEKIKPYIEEIKPSFFEITVALAFDYFAKQNVDIAIIETGLGGRLDSTNILKPILSIITNISFDHTDILGETLEEIATEKAGIIKKDIPVIIGQKQEETQKVFIKKAKESNAKIYFSENIVSVKKNNDNQLVNQLSISVKGENLFPNLQTDLIGKYQLKNISTALSAIILLKKEWKIDDSAIKNALENIKNYTNFIGRFQILQKKPLIIVDAAHNENGIKELIDFLEPLGFENVQFIVGFVREKNIKKILDIFPKNASYIATEPKVIRKLPYNQLSKDMKELNFNHISFNSIKFVLNLLTKDIKTSKIFCITGSSFLVADAIKLHSGFTDKKVEEYVS